MIEQPQATLRAGAVSAVSFEGLTVIDDQGNPAELAIIGSDGQILDKGPAVAAVVWNTIIECHRRFMIGEGYLRVHSHPPGQLDKAA